MTDMAEKVVQEPPQHAPTAQGGPVRRRAPAHGTGRIFRRRHKNGREYGNFIVNYCYRGKEYRESCGSQSPSVARALLRRRLGEIGQGRLIGPSIERTQIRDLLDDVIVDLRIKGRASLRTVTAHVAALLEHLDGVRAVDLTTARVRRIIETWQNDRAAAATINKRLGTLRRAFRLGREAEPPKVGIVPHFPHLKEDNTREGFFEKGEFYAMLAHLPIDLRDFVEWSYWTGMRKSEAASMTWAAFDRETWVLTLPGSITKNGKSKKLPLVGAFRAIMERRIAVRRLDCPFIFWRIHDGKRTARCAPGQAIPIGDFDKAWATACEAVGIMPGRHGRIFHDLRRTGVRNLVQAGVDPKTAMRISGHRTASMFARYNIGTDDDLRDAAERVTSYVNALPEQPTVVPLRSVQN